MNKKFEKAQKLRNNGEIEEAIKLYKEIGDSESLHMIGVAYYQAQKFEEANKYLEQALGEFAEKDDLESIGFVYRDFGMVARGRKDLNKAKEYFLQSIENLKKAGNVGHEGMSHVKLGRILADQNKFKEAYCEIDNGIELLEGSKDKFFLSSAYWDRAKVDAQKSLYILNSFAKKDEFKNRREEISKILS